MSRIIVLGSINMDVVVTAPRHPVPGETLFGDDVSFHACGKGSNQAVAAGRLGGTVQLIGKLGRDTFGDDMQRFLEDENLDLTYLQRDDDAPTGTALITVSEAGENTIVVISGANSKNTVEDVDPVAIEAGDIVLSQFEVPQPAIKVLFEKAKSAGALTMLNPAPAGEFIDGLLPLVDYLVVNETELALIAGQEAGTDDESIQAAVEVARTHAEQTVIVTLGGKGLVCVRGDDMVRLAGHDVNVVDTTGAGDCFVGALAVAVAEGQSLADALAFANRAASISVQRPGAAPSLPQRAEIEL